jgi:tol-pal system protein YbgF
LRRDVGRTYNSAVRRLAIVLLLASAGGCAGPATQLRRERSRLDAELTQTRAELRKERRRAQELETENIVLRDKLETREVGAARVGEPQLPVEVLAPDEPPPDDEIVSVTDDGTEIVYVGEAASGRSYSADDVDLSDGDDLPYTPDDDDRPAPKPVKKVDGAASAYEAAVAKVKAKDHSAAVAALRDFLERYPRHDLADNAQYWLGEVYYDAKDYPRAVVEFRATVESYPRGNKVPDALLKMGFCFAQLGQTAKARAALQQVIETYPRTQPAELASRKLGELK